MVSKKSGGREMSRGRRLCALLGCLDGYFTAAFSLFSISRTLPGQA